MNARTLPPELARTAAQARMRAAKDAFTKASVAVLHGRPDSMEHVTAALEELNAAREELKALDAQDQQALSGESE